MRTDSFIEWWTQDDFDRIISAFYNSVRRLFIDDTERLTTNLINIHFQFKEDLSH